ncbi:hypothetical protein GE061_008378 [Apolygus lucorum]|uniref:Peptidase S1 domain-containing protein n=1 Tax=Apolygus lucorum TaxID=248454 RepID=A0A8S9WS42_APOLU|nr:hypothetical protein GE061_008378 [Apolygus lucorum]
MGQLYSKVNQLLVNDLDTAADPDRPREKLETAFTTPARAFRLPDPRSATLFINRTPILVNAVDCVPSEDTPKAPKSVARPRYLETDLDEVIPDSAGGLQTSVVQHLGVSTMTTSTPVRRTQPKTVPSVEVTAEEVVDSVIEEAVEKVSSMRFSDTGICEVVTSERSASTSAAATSLQNQAMMSSTIGTDSGSISFPEEVRSPRSLEPSYAEEIFIQLEDVKQISCVDDFVEVILEEGSESLVANWSGVGGPDHSLGADLEVSMQNFISDSSQPEVSIIVQDWGSVQEKDSVCQDRGGDAFQVLEEDQQTDVEQDFSIPNQRSDSMIVHNDSESFTEPSGDFEWDNDSDSLLVSSPAIRPGTEMNNMKNAHVTPKKTILTSKPGGRTPLGDVSTNSPVIQHNLTPKQTMTPKQMNKLDNKIWKNIRDERLKRGINAENTPPQAAFNSYPPEVVQSAPGKEPPIDSSPQPQSSRSKRQVIPPDVKSYLPAEWFGPREDCVVRIRNVGVYKGYDLSFRIGVRLQSRMVLTTCSAVTYLEHPGNRVVYRKHKLFRAPVDKVRKEDLSVRAFNLINEPDNTVKQVLIHPQCDNQYLMDFAVLLLDEALPDSKNVWIHTPENLLFRRNLDRVVAAQAVLGTCSLPTYTRRPLIGRYYKVEFVPINFQHWDGCRADVCSYWGNNDEPDFFQDNNRCENRLNSTRFCIAWHKPMSMCKLAEGAPIFCDIGNIRGLIGFYLKETYTCLGPIDPNGIMVAVGDALDWIYETLTMRLTGNYDREVPEWVRNLRWNYSRGNVPKIPINITKTTTVKPEAVAFDDFQGDQVLSVVIVWNDNHPSCQGVMIAHLFVIAPCSCITKNPYNMSLIEHIFAPEEVKLYLDFALDFYVSLMINGSKPRIRALRYILSPKCNSHAEVDLAMIELRWNVPYHKLAWIMTSHRKIMETLIKITTVSDASFANDCYWMKNIPFSSSPFGNQRVRVKIRFVHWHHCVHQTCPNQHWFVYHFDRCYGTTDSPEPKTRTLFCFESRDPKYPACDMLHGTPIFCNNEAARGFIGLYTKAMDLNLVPCQDRPLEQRTGVFVGIDQFIDDFRDKLWINEMEVFARDLNSSPFSSPTAPSIIFFLVFLNVVFYVTLKV